MSVYVAAACLEDAPDMAALFLAARRAAMPYLPELHPEADVLRWMAAVVISESRAIKAVSPEGRLTGFASTRPGHLDHLYVAPPAQRQGAGSALLAAAKEESPQGLRLCTFQRNVRARAFYERRGFRLVELRNGAQNEEREPDAVYDWRP